MENLINSSLGPQSQKHSANELVSFLSNRTMSSSSDKHGSIYTIFSCWNTMVGSGILALPWTFYHAGMVWGVLICFVNFCVSLHTCKLCLRLSDPKQDFFSSMKTYWGHFGYILSVSATLLSIHGAQVAYFMIMTQMLYPNSLQIANSFRETPRN